MLCDIGPLGDRRFRSVRESLDCRPLSFKLDVGVAPEHSRADVPRDVQNHTVWNARLTQGRNRCVPQIVEAQTTERALNIADVGLAILIDASPL